MQTKFRFALCFVLISVSPALFALGLGGAQVRSFLNQPLNARIELISQSQEELNTVLAGLASAADFEIIGLSRTVSVPLRFEVNAELANAYVTVTSRLPISDPVVQLVIEVTWTGGRMLREYNLFLDPPTFASRAPAPALISRPAPRPARDTMVKSTPVIPAPETLNVVQARSKDALPEVDAPKVAAAKVDATEVDVHVADENAVPGERVATHPQDPEPGPHTAIAPDERPASAQAEALPGEARQTVTVPDGPLVPAPVEQQPDLQTAEQQPEPQTVEELPGQESGQSDADSVAAQRTPEPQTEPEPEPGIVDRAIEADSTDEIIGPVQRGETLWGIASGYSRGKGYSINQAMLAIQRLNPEAFGHNNINSLKQGAILRMPTFNEAKRLSNRQAMLEAIRQETAYQAMRAGLPYDSSLPVIADTGIETRANNEEEGLAALDVNPAGDQGVLKLVPPSEREETGSSGSSSGAQPTGALSTQEVREVLARTEEELANAQQENTYLNERIRELETKIAQSQTDGTVVDRELSEMEASLREGRLSDEVEQPIAVMPPRDGKSWFAGRTPWLAVLLLLLVAAVVWFLKRNGSAGDHGPDPENDIPGKGEGETVQDIRSVADELPQSPQTRSEETAQGDNVIDLEDYVESELRGESGHAEPAVEGEKAGQQPGPGAATTDEAEAIDPDSSDPEIKLDLARAYISMGDDDAARQMLEEVLEVGNEAQVREAQEMMGEL